MDRIIEITEDYEEWKKEWEQEIGNRIDQAEIKDQAFQASLENKWEQFQQLYTNNEFLHEYRFNRFEDTALHIAISSYHPDRDYSLQDPHLTCIREMIASIPKENRLPILRQKNEKGNTPLHLAAELGFVPIIECLVNPESLTDLIWETNSKGETPLFITTYRGKLEAFLYLHKCVQDENGEGPIELCRRKDGDNILHAAISGEYFEVTFQIIHYYQPLVNYYNIKGMSPLHVLARMPQVFRRGHFRFIDSIIRFCINIDELKLMTYEAEGKGDLKLKLGWNLPENYQALVKFLELLSNGTRIIRDYIKKPYFGCQGNKSKTTTQATNVNPEKKSPGHQSYHQNDPENPPITDTTRASNTNQDKKPLDTIGATNTNQDKQPPSHQIDRQFDHENPPIKAEDDKWFPANYTIFIKFLKCVMKIVLFVLAIGFPWIKKFEERKRQHGRGVQIMKLLIEKDERYKWYGSTGEKPKNRPEDRKLLIEKDESYKRYKKPKNRPEDSDSDLAPPTEPPSVDDTTRASEQAPTSITAEEKIAVHKSEPTKPTKETPLLEEASRMGIVEMVEKIVKIFPTAIQDTDSKELSKPTKETPLLVAAKMGIVEMVKIILEKYPIAIQDMDSDEKNILLLAVEHRQPDVYNWLRRQKYPPYVYYQVDKDGNNAVHLAAMFQKLEVWRTPGSALQLQDERKWYKYVKQSLPPQSYVPYNNKGQTPRAIFIETHANLLKDATEWLIKTANSCSVVAALIATVAFTTAATIPGGPDDLGHPHFQNQPAFEVFCISSLVSLCFSVSALVFFLAILTSRCQHEDFEKDLPRKLLIGLTSLFASITAIMVSFCAAHFFILQDKFKEVAFLIYVVTCIPVVFFAFNQFPLYVDLMSSSQELPIRSYKGYKEFFTDSSVASSSDQKKADKAKDV